MEIEKIEEKKWLMAYANKREKGHRVTANMTNFVRKWNDAWQKDKLNENPALAEELYNWVLDTCAHNTLDEMRQRIFKIKQKIPKALQKKANDIGLTVLAPNIVQHPLSYLRGYALIKTGNRRMIFGKNFDKSFEQIEQFIEHNPNVVHYKKQ